ncbi:MAG: helix-turn-helix domain-containing protein [Bacilli bacterium]
MNNQFSENLKRIRKEHNLSQEQLADELGVSRQAISKWESAVAYPEMEKIIALCNKFNLNIDDLLHKDIKEVKGEEESKKKINSLIDDFLKFITDTINLFSNMNFKSKMKCLFEQIVVITILFFISLIIVSSLNYLFASILSFLPDNAYLFITSILESIFIIFCIISSIIILTHIFKTRYLDYFDKLKQDINIERENSDDTSKEKSISEIEIDKNNKILFKKNENKIIIRDPKHSEYRFINGLFKIIIYIIKFFLLCFALLIAFILICLFGTFIISFLTYKTGFFFIGLLIVLLSFSVITIIVLLLILNFIFNRKSDKKKIIWSFIISLIVFGIGCGLIFIGSLSFEISEDNSKMLKMQTTGHEMQDDLFVNSYNDLEINYVEENINNLKIEYTINKLCDVEEHYNNDYNNIETWVSCKNPIKVAREFFENINDKKIISVNNNIEKITIYTNKTNIEKLKNNSKNFYEKRKQYDETINYYENKIIELETNNADLNQKLYDLQEELDNLKNAE